MVDAVDFYWGLLYCFHTLILSLLAQMYKMDTGYGIGGAAEVTASTLRFQLHLFPMRLNHPQLKGPSQPNLCFSLQARVWLLNNYSMSPRWI